MNCPKKELTPRSKRKRTGAFSALDDAKLGAVIAGGVVAAGMKVAPKKYRKKYKACQKKLRVDEEFLTLHIF